MARGGSVRRNPDAGVGTAAASLKQNAKSKRMLMFGLRSLSEFCLPPTLLAAENSLDTLSRGAVPIINTAVATFADDEDLIQCASMVLFGISAAIREGECIAEADQLVSEGANDAIIAIANSGSTDPETVGAVMDYIENMAAIGHGIDGSQIAAGLLSTLTKGSLLARVSRRVVGALVLASSSSSGVAVMYDNSGSAVVLKSCVGVNSLDSDCVILAEHTFDVVLNMANGKSCLPGDLDYCMTIMDTFKTKKSVTNKGSAALAAMVGPDELQQCLSSLQTAPADSPERDEALTTLSCMSYITSYTDDIVKAGGIALLIELISNGLETLDSNPEKTQRMIGGAAKMLARIGANVANVDKIIEAGGLATIATTITYATAYDDCLAGLSLALVPLVTRGSQAEEMIQYQVVPTVLPILYQKVESKDVSGPLMELIATVSQHPTLHPHLLENQAVEILATCCQYNTDDAEFQLNAIKSITNIAPNLTSIGPVYDYGGLQGLAYSLSHNTDNLAVAQAAVLLMAQLAQIPDASAYMSDGANVDSILEAMLAQENDEKLMKAAVQSLDAIASENDCSRHLDALELALQNAARDPSRVHKTLAAVAGLCRVSHLKEVFQAKSAAEQILKGVVRWIEGNAFEGSFLCTQIGIKSSRALKLNCDDDLSPFFIATCNAACIPQLKRMIELQDVADNCLIDLAVSTRDFAKTGRLPAEQIYDCVEAILKPMRKFTDSRRCQVVFTQALTAIAREQTGEGVQALIKAGGINTVVQYLTKKPVYLDAQIEGYTMLVVCVRADPQAIELIRKTTCLDAITVSLRTHSKSVELKKAVAPLAALLMPDDELERQIRERMDGIRGAMSTMNPGHLHENLCGLNDLLVTNGGAKIAGRNEVGQLMAQVAEFIETNADTISQYKPEDEEENIDFFSSCLSETAQVLNQSRSARVARVNMCKNGGIQTELRIFQNLHSRTRNGVTEEGITRTLDGLGALIRHEKASVDKALEQGTVALLCAGVEVYPDSSNVICSTCSCLAAIATTPANVEMMTTQPEFDVLLKRLNGVLAGNKESKLKAISALQELLKCEDASMTKKVAESGAVQTLFAILEEHNDDPELTAEAARTLAMIGDFEDLRSYYEGDVRTPIASCTTALQNNRNICSTTIPLMNVLNKMTTADDKLLLKEAGCIDVVSDIMMIHSEDAEITRIGGELFAKMGADEQIKSLMQQIIKAVELGGDYVVPTVDRLCCSLAMFLAAPIDNPDDALASTEQCLQSIDHCLLSAPNDSRFAGNATLVSRRLVDRAFDNPDDSYGAWAVASSGHLATLVGIVNQDTAVKQNSGKKFVASTYRNFGAVCNNPYTLPAMNQNVQNSDLLGVTYNLLNQHKDDPETVARILDFLKYYAASDEAAAAKVANMQGAQGDIVKVTLKNLKNHKGNASVFAAGTGLLGVLATNGPLELNSMALSGELVREAENALGSNPDVESQVAMMDLIGTLLGNEAFVPMIVKEKEVERVIGRLSLEDDEKRFDEKRRSTLYAGCNRMLYSSAPVIPQIEKANGFDTIMKGLEDHPEDVNVTLTATFALANLAQADPNLSARCTHEAVPKLISDQAPLLQSSYECADGFCELCLILLQSEGTGRSFTKMEGFEENLQGIEALADYYGDENGQSLKEKVARIRLGLAEDETHEPSCKQVYLYLSARATAENSNALEDCPVIVEKFDFLFTQMYTYGQEYLDSTTDMGADHQYGNMAYSLLAEEKKNLPEMYNRSFVSESLSCIKHQTDEHICDYSLKAFVVFSKTPDGANMSLKTQGCLTVIVDCIQRLSANTSLEYEDKNQLFIPRLQAVEKTAVNRNVYNKTKIMTALLQCWKEYDDGVLSVEVLKHVFKAMRRVVSDAHVEELLNANALARLKMLVENRPPDLVILPDVLFLIGSLGAVPDIKTKLGEIGAIEACVVLLREIVDNDEAISTMTNCCLALANLTVGHKKNSTTFHKLEGPILNVEIINKRGDSYDVGNAASVLLCNTLYKNESMKKAFGANGAAAALVSALETYDGSNTTVAVRCLQSHFKAISNLSLYTPNVQLFLAANIENAYVVLFTYFNAGTPEIVIQTALRTLTNLVAENEESNMIKFGVCLIPLLKLTETISAQSAYVVFLQLEVLNALCRHAPNADQFVENGGIPAVINLIHTFDYDVTVISTGIHLMGTLAGNPNNVPALLEADIFALIVGCCEVDAQGNEVTDMVIGGLRCTRRIVKNDEIALQFAEAGGIECVQTVIANSTTQPAIALEAYRLLLTLLGFAETVPLTVDETIMYHEKLGQSSAYDGVDAEADEEDAMIADEESVNPEKSATVYAGWIRLNMSLSSIDAIVQATCTTLLEETHLKQLRLQKNGLAVCGYFASHRLGLESLAQSNYGRVVINCCTNFSAEPKVTSMLCLTINNIAYGSGDVYDNIKNKELVDSIKTATSKIPSKDVAYKDIKAICSNTTACLQKDEDPFIVYDSAAKTFDVALSGYNVDPFPNGVQDIPADSKTLLRKGNSIKLVLPGNSDKETLNWRASQDLHYFEYCYGKDSEYGNRVPIMRLKNFSKGISGTTLIDASKKEPRKITANVCAVICGPVQEDHPNGLALSIKAKNKKERDAMIDLLVLWRDAATYDA